MNIAPSEIRIRPYELGDVDGLYDAVQESMPAMQPWMPWCHAGYSIEEARQWVESKPALWESGETKDFVIEDAAGRFLGGCGLNQFRPLHRVANLGYWLRFSARGQGIMTQAVRLLADWTFRETQIDRLEIVVAIGNIASQCVAERVGAIREGFQRQGLLLNGQRHDAVMNSLLRSDWQRIT